MHANPKNDMHANPKSDMHTNPKSDMHANPKSDMHANPKSDMHANPKSYIRRLVEPKGYDCYYSSFGDRFGELGELFRVEGEFLSQQLGLVAKSIHPSQFKRIDHLDLSPCFNMTVHSSIFAGIQTESTTTYSI